MGAIFCPFSPLTTRKIKILTMKKTPQGYYHFTHLHHKWKSYDVWFLRYGAWQTIFVILDHFLPFYPPRDPENQNFEKMQETPEDIFILQMCTINDSHMMYGSWDVEYNGQNFVILDPFLPFYPLTTQKIKILKK